MVLEVEEQQQQVPQLWAPFKVEEEVCRPSDRQDTKLPQHPEQQSGKELLK